MTTCAYFYTGSTVIALPNIHTFGGYFCIILES